MTESLRDALRNAAADGTAGPAATGRSLLQRGRRRARRRTISGTAAGGLALVAAIGVPFGPSMFDDSGSGSTVDQPPEPTQVAKQPPDKVQPPDEVLPPSSLDGACLVEEYKDWPVVVAVSDDVYTTAVFVSPDGNRSADCTAHEPTTNASLSVDYGLEANPGYRVHVGGQYEGCLDDDTHPCSWYAAGQIPADVVEMVFTSADGRSSEAAIRNGFFAWQSEVDGIDVFDQPLWVELYDADGVLIDRMNANPGGKPSTDFDACREYRPDDWTVAVAMRGDDHTTSVLASPNGDRWAACVREDHAEASSWFTGVTGGAGPENPYAWAQVLFWSERCAKDANPAPCLWGTFGQMPADVARLTFETPDGETSDAEIRDGFFVWHATTDSIEELSQPVWVTLYDADGNPIHRLNANLNVG
jgi:hypothetical protein